jgi:glycosyltransferase involved in cell wall biosynthesis
MERAKVSILIPAKNERLYLSACLDSILAQDYYAWEVLLIDDNSTDNTYEIAQKYAAQDARIHCFRNRGTGIISALEMAFFLSKGSLITRMDADDLMRPAKLSLLSSKLEEAGRGHIAVGAVHYFSAEKVKSGFRRYEEWLNLRTAEGSNFQDIFRECAIPSPNWMLYRADLIKIGAFEHEVYPEDYDLAFRMFLGGLTVIPCSEVTHDWRDYPLRTSRTAEVYKDHTFTAIKWSYFERFFRQPAQQLVLFGTGYRGKRLAAHLIKNDVSFVWVSNNPEKIGKHIYEVMIEPLASFDWQQKQIIATIANENGRSEVNEIASEKGLKLNVDLFHFA